jgi:hypothetical protein
MRFTMSLLTIFRKMLHHADLMDSMTVKLGVRDAMANRPGAAGVMRRASNRCLSCTAAGECEDWLATHDSADAAPSFCRNSELFERLKHEIEADGITAH